MLIKKVFVPIVLICSLLLASCQSAGTPSGSTSQPSSGTTSSSQPSENASQSETYMSGGIPISAPDEFPIVTQPVTLTAWTSSRPHIKDPETNTMTLKYEEKTGVHIDWTIAPAEGALTQLNLSFASGDYFDMYLTNLKTEQVTMCIEGNVLVPLDDMIETHGVNTKQALADNPLFVEYMTAPDGHIYTLMETDIGVHMIYKHKMFVYEPWLQKLGGVLPTTTQEYKDFLIRIRDEDLNGNGQKDEIPLISNYSKNREGDPLMYFMNSFQLSSDKFYYITEDGKLVFSANTDGWRDGLRYMNDLYKEGLFYAEETYTQDQDSLKALVNKKEGEDFLVGTVTHFFQGRFIDTATMKWTDYVPIGPLKGPTGLQHVAAAGPDFKLTTAISTQCKYPEIAFKWLDYWVGEQGAFDNVYGMEEGVDYEWVDLPAFSGAPRSIQVLTNTYDANFRWGQQMLPKVDSFESRYVVTDDESTYQTSNTFILLQGAELYKDHYVLHNVPQVVWSDADLAAKVVEYETLFKDYIERSYTEFILGVRSLDNDWDAYKAELDKMGLAEYMDVLRQYYSVS